MSTSTSSTDEHAHTGVKVLIIGAGFAGLACAIESKRKGHDVLIIERFKELKIISFGNNAGRIFEKWGLHEQLWPICTHLESLKLHNSQGNLIAEQKIPKTLFGAYAYNGHRGEIHQILYNHAHNLGIEFKLGRNVTEYWENSREGGVIVDGERMSADVVVGADGVRSKARKLVLGYDENPKSSGYAIYRAWFDAYECGVDKDPLTRFMCDHGDEFYGWIGNDVHLLVSTSRGGRKMSWVITHKDEANIEESWSFPGRMSDVLKVVEGWDPRCAALLSKAPSCVDWKIVYRDPLPTWISKEARLVLIGDAAHPFLPTSIQGASQAMEDGVTLAVLLQMAGKDDAPLAARAFEEIRYKRVRLAQLTGETTRDKWHKSKADATADEVVLEKPEWLLGFDAEKHAYQVWDEVKMKIVRDGYQLPVLP